MDCGVKRDVMSTIDTYVANADGRSALYENHKGLRDLFDFLGTPAAGQYAVLRDFTTELPYNTELLVYDLMSHPELTVALGAHRHRLWYRGHHEGGWLRCIDKTGQRCRLNPGNRIVLLRVKQEQITTELVEDLLRVLHTHTI